MTMPIPLDAGSLEHYFHSINKISILSAEEEYALAKSFRDNGDLEAARLLVLSHLRFVAKIARGYSGYGLPQADLIQEGGIGLMKAVKRFDPDVGVRLIAFAVHWIRAEIHEYVLRNWKIVKIATTKAQRKLFFNLRSAKKRLAWLNKDEVDSIANDLGVKTQDVIEMEKRISGQDISFDVPEGDDQETNYLPASYLASAEKTPEEILEMEQNEHMRLDALKKAIDTLDERSKKIVSKRWLKDKKSSLQQLATEFNISAERIRQIEQAAFKKMAANMC